GRPALRCPGAPGLLSAAPIDKDRRPGAPPRPRSARPSMQRHDVPLCVDLDGTLIHSDLLVESAFALLRRNPFWLACFVVWLLRGRAHLKQEIARRARLDVARLPYDER